MIRYVKCPRCELNYIDADKQEYCDVCIAELKGNKLAFADLDDEEIEEAVEEENEATELCPVCGVNYMRFGETMCDSCKKNAEYSDEEEVDPEQDEEWKNYLGDDTEDLSLEDNRIDEDLKKELEEEEEEEEEDDEYHGEDEDDFFDDYDDLDDVDDDGYDDDDDDDEEDDDDLF